MDNELWRPHLDQIHPLAKDHSEDGGFFVADARAPTEHNMGRYGVVAVVENPGGQIRQSSRSRSDMQVWTIEKASKTEGKSGVVGHSPDDIGMPNSKPSNELLRSGR